jgi:hypothetical protein
VGDTFHTTIDKRWLLDTSYYIIITIGMLNLIAGVIITTFGQLRENKIRRMDDTVGVCFICGIDKQTFDRASDEPDGFKTHIKVDHNIWNYLYFIFMLWEQDKDDDDGLEQYVRRAINANEITWFPLNKAIRLDHAASEEDSLSHGLNASVTHSEHVIAGKLDRFQTEIQIVLEQLNLALKQDHMAFDPSKTKGSKTVKQATSTLFALGGSVEDSNFIVVPPEPLSSGSSLAGIAVRGLYLSFRSLVLAESNRAESADDMSLVVRVDMERYEVKCKSAQGDRLMFDQSTIVKVPPHSLYQPISVHLVTHLSNREIATTELVSIPGRDLVIAEQT